MDAEKKEQLKKTLVSLQAYLESLNIYLKNKYKDAEQKSANIPTRCTDENNDSHHNFSNYTV
jgi:hypothetical protein